MLNSSLLIRMYDIIKNETVEPYVDTLRLTVQHVHIAEMSRNVVCKPYHLPHR